MASAGSIALSSSSATHSQSTTTNDNNNGNSNDRGEDDESPSPSTPATSPNSIIDIRSFLSRSPGSANGSASHASTSPAPASALSALAREAAAAAMSSMPLDQYDQTEDDIYVDHLAQLIEADDTDRRMEEMEVIYQRYEARNNPIRGK